ncbi:hypothetical protein B296_00051012 [Ensete ventricosum]|uniref:Uncharacterized protein n=1 Tax=Ensete ventricosum TaxID=4639 RepID=A0A426YG27_ENSVE|nr:hypothetical protein B296_00051012 [Ensete ventricosum]
MTGSSIITFAKDEKVKKLDPHLVSRKDEKCDPCLKARRLKSLILVFAKDEVACLHKRWGGAYCEGRTHDHPRRLGNSTLILRRPPPLPKTKRSGNSTPTSARDRKIGKPNPCFTLKRGGWEAQPSPSSKMGWRPP